MLTQEQLESFLRKVDHDFPVPLSNKQDLSAYASKLLAKATLCVAMEEDEIVSLVAGYTRNLPDNRAYIAVVATLPRGRGQGLAPKLVQEFLDICKERHICAVHLYTAQTNTPAVMMYEALNFHKLLIADEPRPNDVHLICYLEETTT